MYEKVQLIVKSDPVEVLVICGLRHQPAMGPRGRQALLVRLVHPLDAELLKHKVIHPSVKVE